MRLGLVIVLLFVAAIPTAAALGEVSFGVPDVRAHVEGQTYDLERSAPGTAAAPVRPTGEVGYKDVDVRSDGMSCTLKAKGRVLESCETGDVETSAPHDILVADVGLRFGSLEAAPVEASATETAATDATEPEGATGRTMLVAAAAAGASAALLYGLWRVLKLGGLAALIPLYSHISDDEILDDPNRAAIYRLIQQEAGVSTKDIADRLGLAWGTVTHHLGKLEKRRFVVSKKYGKYRRYFANGEGGTEKKDAVAVLRLDRTGDVAALIKAQPGLTQKAVSQALGVSSSTILWHVKRLEDVQLVRKVRDGKLVRYYPAETQAPLASLVTVA